jgi:6-phosphogluconate dehydrogenase
MKRTHDIGLIGLAVMGQNLVLNLADHGFAVAVFNRSPAATQTFLAGEASGKAITGCFSLQELVTALAKPRRILLMVKAGSAVDETLAALLPLLDAGDIVMDGGNSHFPDTRRRQAALAAKQIRYLGVGISGGEEGARHGPSIMPGGDASAWPQVMEIFRAISAKVEGEPCCEWIGPDGSGHFVKMVHNGIEYGDMQLIAEGFDLLQRGLDLPIAEIQPIFERWNRGVLDSYLIEITAKILSRQDDDGCPLVEKILDTAQQKGTGQWTVSAALEQGAPLTLITEAVFARALSARKEERVAAAPFYPDQPKTTISDRETLSDRETMVRHIHDALYAAKIISYAQGFQLLQDAAKAYGWPLEYGNLAKIWRGGCIIRSRFLNNIRMAYANEPNLPNLLVDPFFRTEMQRHLPGWRSALQFAVGAGIPTPALSSALAWFDGYRSATLPANLVQAQRDFFGAHTYERTDRPRGEFFHTDWQS